MIARLFTKGSLVRMHFRSSPAASQQTLMTNALSLVTAA